MKFLQALNENVGWHSAKITNVTVEHVLPPKNAMFPMVFDPGASRIAL
jgi:hypothetical protein